MWLFGLWSKIGEWASGVETAETKRAQNNEIMFARKCDCQDGWK